MHSSSMCTECGAILTNDSMKSDKLKLCQKSKNPSSVGKDRKYFENKKKDSQSNYPTIYRR